MASGADPLRRILHCDMDSFYAAVHIRDDPALGGQPVVIGGGPSGRGVVAAASYAARRFGIHSAMPAARARKLCPRAIFIKPDFARYRRESEAVFDIFRRFTPLVQTVSLDEAYLDVSERLQGWGSATAVAREIRRLVREERRLTVSVGVGPNRLVAKIASDFHKPDGLTVVTPAKVRAFLDPLPVRRLPGVGPATERSLRRMGVRLVGDLRRRSLDELTARFGRHGRTLWEFARGIDERPVRAHRQRKSLSTERTYRDDLTRLSDMDAELERLVSSVAAGLDRRSLSACTVTVKVRYGDFTTISRSLTLPAPTAEAAALLRHARMLLRRSEAPERSVRLLGVGVSNLVRGEAEQLSLFGATGPSSPHPGLSVRATSRMY